MKILIDSNACTAGEEFHVFKNQSEWDNYYSTFKPGMFYPAAKPYTFPCLMISGDMGIIYNSNGPNAFVNIFIYDFQIMEE